MLKFNFRSKWMKKNFYLKNRVFKCGKRIKSILEKKNVNVLSFNWFLHKNIYY